MNKNLLLHHARLATAATLLGALPALSCARPPIGGHVLDPGNESTAGILAGGMRPGGQPAAPQSQRAATPFLVNTGFESLSGNHPVGWEGFGAPTIGVEGSNHFAESNDRNYYLQSLNPRTARQHLSYAMKLRGDLGLEFGRVSTDQTQSGGQTVFFSQRASLLDGGDTDFFGTIPIVPFVSPSPIFIRFSGGTYFSWSKLDNVEEIDEGFSNRGFESPLVQGSLRDWSITGGSVIEEEEARGLAVNHLLQLDPGGSATQAMAAYQGYHNYFVTGEAKSLSPTGSLDVITNWRWINGADLGETSATLALSSTSQRFVWEAAPTDLTNSAVVELANRGASPIFLDDVSRGFTLATPRYYYPVEESGAAELSLIANWPGELASGQVSIVNSLDAEVAVLPLAVTGNIGLAKWDGASQAAGEYEARFTLLDGEGGQVQVTRLFELRTDFVPQEPQAYTRNTIVRGAWTWLLNDGDSIEELRPVFEQLLADGFNFAIVFGHSSQWPAISAICEEFQIPFVAAGTDTDFYIKRAVSIPDYNLGDYLKLLDDYYGSSTFENPFFEGIYIVDEPEPSLSQPRTELAMIAAASIPRLKRGWTTVTPPEADGELWDRIPSPVHWTDFYGYYIDTVSFKAGLLQVSDHVKQQVQLATERGREYWYIAQAFTSPEFFREGNDAATRANIGVILANGAKGYVPFHYRSIGGFEGIRGRELQPASFTDVWIEENERIASAANELFELHSFTTPVVPTGDVLITRALDATNQPVLFAVSLDVLRDLELTLQFDEATGSLTELTSSAVTPITGSQAIQVLGPGEWRVWSLNGGELEFALATPVSPTPVGVDLPVLKDVQFSNDIYDIRFNEAADTLLVAANSSAILTRVNGGNIATWNGASIWRARFGDAGEAYICSFLTGLYQIVTEPPYTMTPVFARKTGNAWDVVSRGDGTLWLTQEVVGVRLLQETDVPPYQHIDHELTGEFARDMVGPFPDGSVLILDSDVGIYRATRVGDTVQTFNELPMQRLWRGALTDDLSALAVARNNRGILLATVDPANGEVLSHREYNLQLEFIEDVAWIHDSVLAVADSDGEIGFYRFDENGDELVIATWRGDLSRPGNLAVLESHGTLLAVGAHDGRLMVLDTASLFEEGWVLD